MEQLEVSYNVVKSMDIGRVFRDHDNIVNSVAFSDSSDLLATAGDDNRVNIYSVQRGSLVKDFRNLENGVGNLRFTHYDGAVVCSTRVGREHLIKYWNIEGDRRLFNFQGHNDLINSLEISPKTDMFLSTANDRFMHIWDLRLRRCLGRCEFSEASGPGVVSFDPSGSIFSLAYPVSSSKSYIKLFDTRNYSVGAFNTWELSCPKITKLQFSDDGNYILATTSENKIYVLDSLDGNTKHTFVDFLNPDGKASAIFSADSRYILTGCATNNSIAVYSVESGIKIHEFRGHPRTPINLAWSRKHVLMVSACQNVLFWVPDLAKIPPHELSKKAC